MNIIYAHNFCAGLYVIILFKFENAVCRIFHGIVYLMFYICLYVSVYIARWYEIELHFVVLVNELV